MHSKKGILCIDRGKDVHSKCIKTYFEWIMKRLLDSAFDS